MPATVPAAPEQRRVRFKCRNCGECCYAVPIGNDELVTIKLYLARLSRIERLRLARQDRTLLMCPLLDTDNHRCATYRVRPLLCRLMGQVEGMMCRHNPLAPLMDSSAEVTRAYRADPVIGILGVTITGLDLYGNLATPNVPGVAASSAKPRTV